MHAELKRDVSKFANPQRAKDCAWFFKTGKGEYGEGDRFLGLTVPEQRKIAKKYSELSLRDLQSLLNSKFHEHRFIALVILVNRFQKAGDADKKKIVNFYLKNTNRINNWDLVDVSAHKILGPYLFDKDKKILFKLAKSKSLWERRIAVISTLYFIANKRFDTSLKIAELLLNDNHDLIHKAVGWMLREIGNRDQQAEEKFLKRYCKAMPRTMLRYAVEKFSPEKRRFYMQK